MKPPYKRLSGSIGEGPGDTLAGNVRPGSSMILPSPLALGISSARLSLSRVLYNHLVTVGEVAAWVL